MGVVECEKDFRPYVPEKEGLTPILEFHWGIMKRTTVQTLLDLLYNITKRLNNKDITVKPYRTVDSSYRFSIH